MLDAASAYVNFWRENKSWQAKTMRSRSAKEGASKGNCVGMCDTNRIQAQNAKEKRKRNPPSVTGEVLTAGEDHTAVAKAGALEELALRTLQGRRVAIGVGSVRGGRAGLLAAA